MKIIKFSGGLGNQMFQYAFYKKCLDIFNEDVFADLDSYDNYLYHQGFELERIFDLKLQRASLNFIRKYGYTSTKFGKISKKFIKSKLYYYSEKCIGFDTKMVDILEKYKYLDGFWHSYKYFDGMESIIQKDFQFVAPISEYNQEIIEEMRVCNSIGVHVRRKDFLHKSNSHFVNLSDTDYYQKAIQYIDENVDSPHFYVFSDDIEWVKNSLRLKNCTYVSWNSGVDSYQDMVLMTHCKGIVIANSTFSWWGAWLNPDKTNKIIVCPRTWYKAESVDGRKINTDDLIDPTWVCI
jgi:hypothetical protein